jgi:hypothetical protein
LLDSACGPGASQNCITGSIESESESERRTYLSFFLCTILFPFRTPHHTRRPFIPSVCLPPATRFTSIKKAKAQT